METADALDFRLLGDGAWPPAEVLGRAVSAAARPYASCEVRVECGQPVVTARGDRMALHALRDAVLSGDFDGGALCVESGPEEVSVVDTKGRAAKVDGRYPHWVSTWCGERYSVITYKTRGEPSPLGPAVYP